MLSALGARGLRELFGVDLITKSMQTIVSAMEQSTVHRLIFMSALGVGESAQDAPAIVRVVMGTALRQIAKDKAAAEDQLRQSNSTGRWSIRRALRRGRARGATAPAVTCA